MREYCVYCGKKIEKASKEHVIQNALGGLYESGEICCAECNNFVSKNIDVPFTSIFNSIICSIPNIVKTNNKKSKPACRGKALYKGRVYDVIIKNGKVVACSELSKKIKGKLPTSEFKIVGYDFSIENRSFVNGMGKIAFNFALDQGISLEMINSDVEIDKDDNGKIENIRFNYLMIPFCPLTPFDYYLELEAEMELYHNLILFSQSGKLWCYIDLFNTFQYYVLLSNKWDPTENIHQSYLQMIQKLDRKLPDIYLRKPKHVLAYTDFYKIKPCMDIEKFKNRIAEAIRLESPKRNMTDEVSHKLQGFLTYVINKYGRDREKLLIPLTCIKFYFDEDDRLRENLFRTAIKFDYRKRENISYPEMIKKFMEKDQIDIKKYTFKKFKRLNDLLLKLNKKF